MAQDGGSEQYVDLQARLTALELYITQAIDVLSNGDPNTFLRIADRLDSALPQYGSGVSPINPRLMVIQKALNDIAINLRQAIVHNDSPEC